MDDKNNTKRPGVFNPIDQYLKKPKTSSSSSSSKSFSPKLKRVLWEMHVGMGVKQALCVMCGRNTIINDVNSGFEGAHIVARNFFVGELTEFDGVPSCKGCNNECLNDCILDFLWVRSRIAPLRKIIMVIYNAFMVYHGRDLDDTRRLPWNVLEHLYGPGKYPAGGGIQNTKQIYEIARVEYLLQLTEKATLLNRQLEETARQMREATEAEIKMMKF